MKTFLSSVLGKRCDVNNGDCMHFCEPLGTSGAKCSCVTGYRLTEDGVSCQPESICIFLDEVCAGCGDRDASVHIYPLFFATLAEFPCGRTAVRQVISTFRRTLLHRQNSSLENANTTDNISSSTPPPSAPTATTPSFLVTNDDEDDESKGTLPLDTYDTTKDPRDEEPKPFKRIVGGDLVIPGEIPWQVL